MKCDVAIIGGGPAGSTAGTLLRKYNPDLSVCILEREVFPRDHIGESLLPPVSRILEEMDCWDKVEAANFPIKLGATYRWGKNPELWDFDFVPVSEFRDETRPAKYTGQRRATAFQVDRSIYDKILLDHAAQSGCLVRQGTKVTKVLSEDDSVTGLQLENGDIVRATHYVDASGNSGILRRAMNIPCAYHPTLTNLAIWDYWQNAEWAVHIGVGGTRIQVRSLPYGWIWFIPMGPTRTSIGLVIPLEYYRQSGKRPAELYAKALADEETLADLLKAASSEGKLTSTKDWSFLADRNYGENWFLIGECAGFADPILSAGVTMAHVAGEEVACTINEIELGGEANWLKEQFGNRQMDRIRTHIRFGDYWYTANEQLKDLKQFTCKLADAVGLDLTPLKSWDWIARGGFIDEDSFIGNGVFRLSSLKDSKDFLADLQFEPVFEKYNVFHLRLGGAEIQERALYASGRVTKTHCYVRDGKVLPMRGVFDLLVKMLEHESKLSRISDWLGHLAQEHSNNLEFTQNVLPNVAAALEAMVNDGWLAGSFDPTEPTARETRGFTGFHQHSENA